MSITYKGQSFPSQVALAEHLDMPVGRLKSRISKGWPEERWAEGRRRILMVTYRGKEWKINALAAHLDLEHSILYYRIKSGWEEKDWANTPDLEGSNDRNAVFYQGKKYKSVVHLASVLGVSPHALRNRIKRNLPESEWAKPSRRRWEKSFMYDGKEFSSPSELARHLGINESRLYQFVREFDGDIDKAVQRALTDRVAKPIKYRGKEFPSRTALAKHLGINLQTLVTRINAGVPEEGWVTDQMRIAAGYCLADMPEEVQQMAISLAGSLGVEPAEAYAQMLEELV